MTLMLVEKALTLISSRFRLSFSDKSPSFVPVCTSGEKV